MKRNEKETIVNFNQEDANAAIFTYERKWQNRLAALGYKPTEDNGKGGLTYEVPKEVIGLPKASRKGTRVLTKAQKQAVRERFAAARAAKAGAKKPAKKVTKAAQAEEEEAPAPKKAVKKVAAVVEDDEPEETVPVKKAVKKVGK